MKSLRLLAAALLACAFAASAAFACDAHKSAKGASATAATTASTASKTPGTAGAALLQCDPRRRLSRQPEAGDLLDRRDLPAWQRHDADRIAIRRRWRRLASCR